MLYKSFISWKLACKGNVDRGQWGRRLFAYSLRYTLVTFEYLSCSVSVLTSHYAHSTTKITKERKRKFAIDMSALYARAIDVKFRRWVSYAQKPLLKNTRSDRSAKWANIGFLDPDTAINQEGKARDGHPIEIFRVRAPFDGQLM